MLENFVRLQHIPPATPALSPVGPCSIITICVQPPMVRQMSAAKQFHRPEHQHRPVKESINGEIVAIAAKWNSMKVFVQQNPDSMNDQHSGDEHDPERNKPQQRPDRDAQKQQGTMRQNRGVPTVKELPE